MKKDSKYCCTLDDCKGMYYNEFFNTFEEAKEAGLKVINEFNNKLFDKDFIPDEDVFDDELIVLKSEIITTSFNSTIKKFYIFLYEEPTLEEHLGKEKIKELSKLIYDFLDKETNDYDYCTNDETESILIEVK